jgi:hypothetical protein
MKEGRDVWATAEPFVSPDRKHSHQFVRHCNDILIKKWKAKNPQLKAVHIWSDGCKGQFKQKKQWHWLTEAAEAQGIRITHNFFQSCHGKGPADGEGAVYKSGLRQAELFGEYMQTSLEAHDWLVKNRTELKQKRQKARHSIHSRCFHYVELGDVNHASAATVKVESDSAAMFRFASAQSGYVSMGLLSCFCKLCFEGKYTECTQPHTGLKRTRCVATAGPGVAQTRQASEAYINKRAAELLSKIKVGMDVLVYMQPAEELAAASYEPMRVVEWNGEWQQQLQGKTYINLAVYIPSEEYKNGWVWNEAELCDKQYSSCYTPEHSTYNKKTAKVQDRKGDWIVPCRKQHCDPKPLTCIRPPLGVHLDSVDVGKRRSQRNTRVTPETQYRTVLVSPGLHQKVLQVLADDAAAADAAHFG